MPTILERFVDDLGATLDDKAKLALLEDADPIESLSILHRLAGRAHEVRNPSAFVATAVRTSNQRGGLPGASELSGALQRLEEDGMLDAGAVEILQRGSQQDACTAVAGLLAQEASTVRNASAYVTRNFANARKNSHQGHHGALPARAPLPPPPMVRSTSLPLPAFSSSQGPRKMYNGGGAAERRPYNPLLAKWRSSLDQKAIDALEALGPREMSEILEELDAKAGSVRNPSAYIQRACDNRRAPSGADVHAARGHDMHVPRGHDMHAPRSHRNSNYLDNYRGVLDFDAIEALEKVEPAQAMNILANLESRSTSVRNPSAYVVRSVANMHDSGSFANNRPPSPPRVSRPTSIGRSAPVIGRAPRGRPMDEFPSPRFPSPRRPTTKPSTSNAYQDNYIDMLDDGARQALDEAGPEVGSAIMQELESKGDRVHNPSAYVLKAVGNARKGKGAGGAVAASAAPGYDDSPMLGRATDENLVEEMQHELARLSTPLDDKALASLDDVNPEAALSILRVLNKQGTQVKNPNAYVTKAVGNEKRGFTAGGMPPSKRMRV